MQAALLFLLFSFLIILGILISMLYVVRQQSVAIVERFGRYQKIAFVFAGSVPSFCAASRKMSGAGLERVRCSPEMTALK